MATLIARIAFTPSAQSVFSFQTTFDGALYTVTIPWLFFGQRYYMRILDANADPVVYRPLIGSSLTAPQSLTAGYFDTQLVYETLSSSFLVFEP